MDLFPIPTYDSVAAANQQTFDALKGKLGMVPNLYATMAHSDTALSAYLAAQNAPTGFDAKDKEVINLVTSQVNGCSYCLAAHTMISGGLGLSPDQIQEVRRGRASFDPKLDILARLTKSVVENRGHADPTLVSEFLTSGWTKAHVVDLTLVIAVKTMTNYLHAATQVPVDFPAAPALAAA